MDEMMEKQRWYIILFLVNMRSSQFISCLYFELKKFEQKDNFTKRWWNTGFIISICWMEMRVHQQQRSLHGSTRMCCFLSCRFHLLQRSTSLAKWTHLKNNSYSRNSFTDLVVECNANIVLVIARLLSVNWLLVQYNRFTDAHNLTYHFFHSKPFATTFSTQHRKIEYFLLFFSSCVVFAWLPRSKGGKLYTTARTVQ